MIITYKGQTLNTKNYAEVSDEEQREFAAAYYAKPSLEVVQDQMRKITRGNVMNDKITAYYFKDLMSQVQVTGAKWTVEDVYTNKEILGVFKAKALNSPKTFPPEKGLAANIERAISLGGKGYARKPTKFPVKTVDYILAKYNVNNVWYDFSAGWGDRLTGALKHNVHYYATDPNYELVDRLYAMTTDWRTAVPSCTSFVQIWAQGSEKFIPELEGEVGLAFSSPPYFNLEDYKVGDQSYKPGTTYESWKQNYLYPTLSNIWRYLIGGGYLAINIKNVNGYNLCEDVYNYAISLGFLDCGVEDLKNNTRIKSTGVLGNSDENIFIFQKPELDK